MSLLSTGTHVDESEEPKAEDITEGSRNYEIEAHYWGNVMPYNLIVSGVLQVKETRGNWS